MPQRRIVTLSVQALVMFILAIAVFVFAGLRTVTFYECTSWFTCGDRIFPSLSEQFAIFEFLHHWAIIIIIVLSPLIFLVSLVVLRRNDEPVMAGVRNTALLFMIQAFAALGTSVISALSQAPAIHFMTAAMILAIALGIILWALFSPNQDYSAPLMLAALVVVSIIPLVPYISSVVS